MINPEHILPLTKQARALGISRGSVYYLPRPVSDRDQALMKRIDKLHLESPFAGARMLREMLNQEGIKVRSYACAHTDAENGHRGALLQA